jgi:hypothetical protein
MNTSNEYKIAIRRNRKFIPGATVNFLDGRVLILTPDDFVVGGLEVSSGTSDEDVFTVGGVVIGCLNAALDNFDGKFDIYDFKGAIINVRVGLQLSDSIEIIKMGVFTVDDAVGSGRVINAIAYDNMREFDRPFSEVSITFPCTMLQLLQAVALRCQVVLVTLSFLNSDHVIERRPPDEAITCREILSWIAQMSAKFGKCNENGALELGWYDMDAFTQSDNIDGGVFDKDTPYSSGDDVDGGDFTFSETTNVDGGTFEQFRRFHHIYSLGSEAIDTDDVVITGVKVKAMGTEEDYGETVLYGTEGYVVVIDNNPLITEGNAFKIASTVGAKLVGMRFRKCNVTAMSDMSIMAGDVAKLSDSKGNAYQILITNTRFKLGSRQPISCDAESPAKNNKTRFEPSTKTEVATRQAIKRELSNYDLQVRQLNSLMANAMGYYTYEEIQPDGSTIEYIMDKPTLAESMVIHKTSIDGHAWSLDGGVTWPTGQTKEGNILANILTTIGINAEWINAGSINGITINSDNGNIGGWKISNYGLYNDALKAGFLTHPNSAIVLYVGNMTYDAMIKSIETGDDSSLPNFFVTRNGDISTNGKINARDLLVSGNLGANNIAHGNVSFSPYANTPTSVNITFGHEFATTPDIVVTANTSVPGSVVEEVSYMSPTKTGCGIVIYRTSNTSTLVSWIAMSN